VEYNQLGRGFEKLRAKISSNMELAVAVTYAHSSSLKGELGLVFNKLNSLKPGVGSYGVNLSIGDQ
jgi:hypothetical protein